MFVSDYSVAVFGASNSVIIPVLQIGPNVLQALLANHNLRMTVDDAWRVGTDISFTVPGQPRQLTLQEQQIFHDSLWDSVEVISLGKA